MLYIDHKNKFIVAGSCKSGCTWAKDWFIKNYSPSPLLKFWLKTMIFIQSRPWLIKALTRTGLSYIYRKAICRLTSIKIVPLDIHTLAIAFHGTISCDKSRILTHYNDYYKFAIVRNPYSRLVSGYIDKIVIHKKWTLDKQGRVIAQNVTFAQFVKMLFTLDKNNIEMHFRPQFYYIPDLEYDRIVKMENFEADINEVCSTIGLSIPKTSKLNASKYADNIYKDRQVFNMMPNEFVGTIFPPAERFYNQDIRNMVRDIYKEDFLKYNYSM